MEIKYILILLVVSIVAFFLGGFLFRKTAPASGQMLSQGKSDRATVGGEVDQSTNDELRGLIKDGRKIEAVEIYREKTGVSLLEAKTAVERMEREL